MTTTPYSSAELVELGESMGSYFRELLSGASSYKRIAGYFSTSVLSVIGNELEKVSGEVQILCNAELSGIDLALAQEQRDNVRVDSALCAEWNRSAGAAFSRNPELAAIAARAAELLRSGKVSVRVVGSDAFGLVHAKVGVVRYPDRPAVSFCGSVNETFSAMERNYEAVWVSSESRLVAWSEAEFERLWAHGVPLSEAVIEHIRISASRKYLGGVREWQEATVKGKEGGALIAPLIDAPLMQAEGLWPHQMQFIDLAFSYHSYDRRMGQEMRAVVKTAARFILADQVGLGKTVQLAAFAILASLFSDEPVLILVPANLKVQWFDEVRSKFGVPVAYWDEGRWILEDLSSVGRECGYGLKRWPRRIGIVSAALLQQPLAVELLSQKRFAAVLVDEAHKHGRDTVAYSALYGLAESSAARSLILATATPMQLKPDESWAMLELLGAGDYGNHVLGTRDSLWREPQVAQKLISCAEGELAQMADDHQRWRWVSDPPIHEEARAGIFDRGLQAMVSRLGLGVVGAEEDMGPADWALLERRFPDYRRYHNPLIEHTVFRTRVFLGDHLPKIKVELHGEAPDEAVQPGDTLLRAFELIAAFCEQQAGRNGSEFKRSFLEQRISSSMYAARVSVERILAKHGVGVAGLLSEGSDDEDRNDAQRFEEGDVLSEDALQTLRELCGVLSNATEDPKLSRIFHLLKSAPWSDEPVLFFSEYRDTAFESARRISEAYPGEDVALYSAADASGRFRGGDFTPAKREVLKQGAEAGKFRFMFGTKAAQEGLNLQAFGLLINIDLPWNPAHLEQRKGRIQRLGQRRQVLHVYNMRYAQAADDRRYRKVAERLHQLVELYGVVPETVAEDNFSEELVRQAHEHPFKMKYEKGWNRPVKGMGAFSLPLALVQAELAKDG